MTRNVAATLVVLLLWASPVVMATVLGGVWMFEHGWFWQWGTLLLVAWSLSFALARWIGRAAGAQTGPGEAGEFTAPADRAAWAAVERIAAEAERAVIPLADGSAYRRQLFEVLDATARVRFPKSPSPHLEVRLPDALAIVAQVASDLRGIVERQVPGSHVFTIREWLWYRDQAARGMVWYAWFDIAFRLARLAWNPVGGVLAEAGGVGFRRARDQLQSDLQRRLQGYAVRLAGRYAIELYSGRSVLRPAELSQFVTAGSSEQSRQALSADEQRMREPLRVLVIGQTKAGKSSLINALFGELRAATGVVPCTAGFQPYVLERAELGKAIVLDSAGYEDPQAGAALEREIRQEARAADVVLLVLSARSAARDADRRVLSALYQTFQQDAGRSPPALILVLTHIDLLSPFAQWQPPYDLKSDEPKAQSIREAMEVVADEMEFDPARIVPVCLSPGRLYNVEQALMPLMVASLPAAHASRLARLMNSQLKETRWSQLWRQAYATGRLLSRELM